MDIFSHALWAAALFKLLNLKRSSGKKFNIWFASLWGIFPDLFTFTLPFVFIISSLILKGLGHIGSSSAMLFSGSNPFFVFMMMLYSLSHSLIIFFMTFLIVYFLFRKPVWVMFGWFIHIIIDIPSHGRGEWATPLFWPLSNFTFNGASWWTNILVIILNYFLLIILGIWLIIKSK